MAGAVFAGEGGRCWSMARTFRLSRQSSPRLVPWEKTLHCGSGSRSPPLLELTRAFPLEPGRFPRRVVVRVRVEKTRKKGKLDSELRGNRTPRIHYRNYV